MFFYSVAQVSSVAQLITTVLILVFVLALTAIVTRWIGNYQKENTVGDNITILEAKRVAPNKLVEIVKIGDKCYALGIGKDEITLIGEVDESNLKYKGELNGTFSFKDFLNKARENGDDTNK